MNFFEYIGVTPQEFAEQYLDTGYVAEQKHHEFPLNIYAYGRKAVTEQKWDRVTSRCRGIVVNRNTGDIVSRPFEKFHNYGSAIGSGGPAVDFAKEPHIWEKMDGFMCTLYTWDGVDYIASKGSFHSIHAKWATAWLRKKFGTSLGIPAGKTAVFEGLHRDLRIVVDYKERQELVLLSVIDNETGEEFSPGALFAFADGKGLSTPMPFNMSLEEARLYSMAEDQTVSEEGYVLTWYQKGKPPFRLKLKFIEYLRLHRMVTGVSPKRIWEVLATKQTPELDEYLKQSTPWFNAFVTKWMRVLNTEAKRICNESVSRYTTIKAEIDTQVIHDMKESGIVNYAGLRKAYALRFNEPENKPFASVMFAMLDDKDMMPVVWKMVKPLTAGANPMVDAHNT